MAVTFGTQKGGSKPAFRHGGKINSRGKEAFSHTAWGLSWNGWSEYGWSPFRRRTYVSSGGHPQFFEVQVYKRRQFEVGNDNGIGPSGMARNPKEFSGG